MKWIVILVGVVSVASAVVWWIRPRSVKIKAMKAYAKRIAGDPGFGRGMRERLAERGQLIEAVKAAPAPTAEEIPELVAALMQPDSNYHYPARVRLEKAGGAAVPALLDAISAGGDLWKRPGSHVMDDSPGERLSTVLWYMKCRETGDRIGHLWTHTDWRVATEAIKTRAATGRAELVPWVLEVLADRTHASASVRRDSVFEGLDRAMEEGWAEAGLLDSMAEWARENILSENVHPEKWAVTFYARHRREEAIDLLRSERVLSLTNSRNIHFVLDALTELGEVLPEPLVRSILEKSLASTEWPWNCTFDAAVGALALIDRQSAVRAAEAAIDDKDRSFGALRFLRKHRGLPFWPEPPPGMAVSSEERRTIEHVLNVKAATGEIGNGGLSQYFFNPSGDNWRRDVASMTAIGFSRGAETLEKAAFIVDAAGASVDRDVRIKQYAAVPEDKEAELDTMSEQFWGQLVEAAEYRYMVRYLDLFQRVAQARIEAGLEKPGE